MVEPFWVGVEWTIFSHPADPKGVTQGAHLPARCFELSEIISFPIPKFGGESKKIGLKIKNGQFQSKKCIFGKNLSFMNKKSVFDPIYSQKIKNLAQ